MLHIEKKHFKNRAQMIFFVLCIEKKRAQPAVAAVTTISQYLTTVNIIQVQNETCIDVHAHTHTHTYKYASLYLGVKMCVKQMG